MKSQAAMTTLNRAVIAEKLTKAFAPERLDVVDESHQHEGHAGHRPGGETHFRVYIVVASLPRKEPDRTPSHDQRNAFGRACRAASTRSPSMPRRRARTGPVYFPGTGTGRAPTQRWRPHRRLPDLRAPRQRRDAQRGDAVALAAQHAEAEAVEGEALARLGDRARLVDDEAGDRGRLVVGQVPVHRAVEVADRHRRRRH